jgi:uncharacterized surface anchored protein
VVFGIFADENIADLSGNIVIPQDSLMAVMSPDEAGKAMFTGDLPFAKMYVKELATSSFYSINKTEFPIESVYAGQHNDFAEFSAGGGNAIPNSLKLGQISIEKTGEMLVGAALTEKDGQKIYQPVYEEKALSGAVFAVIAAEDIKDVYGTTVALKGELVDEITTDSEGRALSRPLHLGRYELVEKVIPAGFVTGEPTIVDLDMNGEVGEVITHFVSLKNQRQRAEITMTKLCELPENPPENFNPYASIRFGLYAKDDIKNADNKAVIPANSLIEIFGVNPDGTVPISTDLPFGSYFIREISTAQGYVLSPEQAAEIVPGKIAEMVIENKLIRGNVRLIKSDKANGKLLAGAEFDLYTPSGEKIGSYKIDEHGEINVENLPYSAGYYFIERTAPKGYLIDDTPISFDITENGATITITAVNELLPEKPDTPDTPKTGDDFTPLPWLTAGGASLIGIVITLIYRKRRKLWMQKQS